MFSLTILGSGSAGNCALVETAQCRLLIDAGLSARQILVRLAQAGVSPLDLDGILLTHEHGDHVGGLKVFCRNFQIPIFCNRLTREVLREGSLPEHRNFEIFSTGRAFTVKDIAVQTFAVQHDAVDPVGFVLENGEGALGFVTDLGFATKSVFEWMRRVDTLVIETNHDEKLLQNDTRRPWPVKQRIMSQHGHLSNTAAAGVVSELAAGRLGRVVLGHLSRDCNTPDLALGAVRSRLAEIGADRIELFCASQTEISKRFAVSGGDAGSIHAQRELRGLL